MTELKKGFEVYYFDGKGGRQGPIDFEEMMTLMGVLDAERAGSDTELYQLPLPFHTPYIREEEGFVPDRQPEEQASAGTGDTPEEGVRD